MFAKIVEIQNFREALSAIHYDTWLILDLDNTVMTSRIDLGGDAWFGGLFKHLDYQRMNLKANLPWVLSIYNAVQQFVRTTPVEPEIVFIIKVLQDIGVPVIGLTARGYVIRHETRRQLADMGVDFSRNSVVQEDGFSCSGGIIFCDGKDKGDQLNAFFSRSRCIPNHVSMLDDKRAHLEHVMLTLKRLKVSFTGFRYGYLDEQVKQFQMELATTQLIHLWPWLSPYVQRNILSLRLMAEPQETADLTSYREHFFHPGQPLLPMNVKPCKADLYGSDSLSLKRTLSTSSFFQNNLSNMERITQQNQRCYQQVSEHQKSCSLNAVI